MDIARDWGWAPEYVDAMWRMLQQDEPVDVIIATGHTFTLEEFVYEAFQQLGLNWRNHVRSNSEMFRPTDNLVSRADPSLAKKQLGWRASVTMPEVVRRMLNDEL